MKYGCRPPSFRRSELVKEKDLWTRSAMYIVPINSHSLSELIEKLTDGLPGTNTVSGV